MTKLYGSVVEAAGLVYELARQQVYEEMAEAGELKLTPAECRELFSLWMNHGMRPPEIHENHPLYTGALKLGALQPND